MIPISHYDNHSQIKKKKFRSVTIIYCLSDAVDGDDTILMLILPTAVTSTLTRKLVLFYKHVPITIFLFLILTCPGVLEGTRRECIDDKFFLFRRRRHNARYRDSVVLSYCDFHLVFLKTRHVCNYNKCAAMTKSLVNDV